MVDKIRELCKQNGTSIFKLEKQLGFGNGVIGRWDKAVPNYERLSAVASALGVSVSDLTGEADEMSTKMVEKIKALCKEKGTSMYKLEKELNIGNGTIGKWGKNGRVPNYANLSAVASALGVTVAELTGEADEKGIKKDPIQKDEVDEMDAELVAIWNDSDETDRKLLLDMARAIKLRRENK